MTLQATAMNIATSSPLWSFYDELRALITRLVLCAWLWCVCGPIGVLLSLLVFGSWLLIVSVFIQDSVRVCPVIIKLLYLLAGATRRCPAGWAFPGIGFGMC